MARHTAGERLMGDVHSSVFDTTDPQRYRASRRVTWTSVAVNAVLSLTQVIVGVVGQSQALVADGIHTLSDLVTDGLVLFALKHSAKEADEEHPYGHGRFETAVTLVLGSMLLLVALGIVWRAADRALFDPEPFAIPAPLTLWIAVLTLVAKEALYRYTERTATRYGSAMLHANAWHHRTDAISSLIVIVGIGGALFGFGYLDALAAVAVSLFVAKIGIDLGWRAMKELVDTSLDPADRDAIKRVIEDVHGVRALHMLRTRRMGSQAFVDVHILVDRRLSTSEGHQIGEVVRERLIKQIGPVTDVMVHIDTEEDGAGGSDCALPLREEIEGRLKRYFAGIPEAHLIEIMALHYALDGVDVELRLPLAAASTIEEARALAGRFAAAARADRQIRKVDVCFH